MFKLSTSFSCVALVGATTKTNTDPTCKNEDGMCMLQVMKNMVDESKDGVKGESLLELDQMMNSTVEEGIDCSSDRKTQTAVKIFVRVGGLEDKLVHESCRHSCDEPADPIPKCLRRWVHTFAACIDVGHVSPDVCVQTCMTDKDTKQCALDHAVEYDLESRDMFECSKKANCQGYAKSCRQKCVFSSYKTSCGGDHTCSRARTVNMERDVQRTTELTASTAVCGTGGGLCEEDDEDCLKMCLNVFHQFDKTRTMECDDGCRIAKVHANADNMRELILIKQSGGDYQQHIY